MKKVFLLVNILLACAYAIQEVAIGVLSFRNLAESNRQWQPTADYLSKTIQGYRFSIKPYYNDELGKAIESKQISFVLTNPEHYVKMHSEHQINAIATLMTVHNGRPLNKFGGVIFCRSDRADINKLEDLKGKTIAAVSEKSFGGYLVQLWSVGQHNVDIKNKANLKFVGQPHDNVVHSVLNGSADVGFVRTGIIEALIKERKIGVSTLKVLNRQDIRLFPQLLSTSIYPEWAFASMNDTSVELSKKVSEALFHIDSSMLCASNANYYGFSPPMDYSDIEALMMRLGVMPSPKDFNISDVFNKYSLSIALILIFSLLIMAYIAYRLIKTNKDLLDTMNINDGLVLRDSLLESLGEGVVGVDKLKKCIFINQTALSMLGYDREEIIGENLSDLACFVGGESKISVEDTLFRKDGTAFPIRLTSTSIIDGHENTIGSVVVFQDITKQKETEKALADSAAEINKLALVAENTDSAVMISDKDRCIEWINSAFTKITGYKLEEVKGKKPGIVLQGEKTDQNVVAFMRDKLAKKETFSVEIINYKKSSEEYWASLSVKPIKDDNGEIVNYFALQSDITARKKSERELMEAIRAAEQANVVKSEFLANMSHEIRTPLNGIIGFVELLKRSANLSKKETQYIELLDRCSKGLLGIINEILDFSKIEADKMQLNINVHSPVDEYSAAVELFSSLALEKNIRFMTFIDPSLPSIAVADEQKIKRVIVNLISNAIKFTPKGGTVSLNICVKSNIDNEYLVSYSVKDTGIGMSEEDVRKLFVPFTQADSSISRSYGGTGLGLAISQGVVKLMGGNISVKSKPNDGSEFFFEIPIFGTNETNLLLPNGFRVGIVIGHFHDEIALILEYMQSFDATVSVLEPSFKNIDDYDVVILHIEDLADLELNLAFSMKKLIIISHFYNKTEPFANMLTPPFLPKKIFSIIKTVANLSGELDKYEDNDVIEKMSGRVLIVDDQETNRILLEELLAQYGLDSSMAVDGCEAFEKFKMEKFDLVFMDMHMPKCDGVQGLKMIREYEKEFGIAPIKVVVLSADVMKGKKEYFVELGFDDYLTKPIEHDILSKFLKDCFQKTKPPVEEFQFVEYKASPAKTLSVENEFFSSSIAAKQLGISEAGVVRSYDSFLASMNDSVPALLSAIDNMDAMQIKAMAHKIKGSASNLRISKLAEVAKTLEDRYEENNLDLFRSLYEQISSIYAVLRKQT